MSQGQNERTAEERLNKGEELLHIQMHAGTTNNMNTTSGKCAGVGGFCLRFFMLLMLQGEHV